MKQRLISLVAVMLCMLVVWMPVAQAAVVVDDPYLPIGDLIKGGSRVEANWSMPATLYYTNTGEIQSWYWRHPDYYPGVDNSREVLHDGWWHIVDDAEIINDDWYYPVRWLEQVVPLTFSENEKGKQLGIFSTIFTQNPGTDNKKTAAEVEADFDKWVQENKPDAQKQSYEMHWFESYESYGSENPTYPNAPWGRHPTDSGFWSGQIAPQTTTTVELPKPNGKILAVLRWKNGEVISVPFTQTANGVMPASTDDWYNGPVAIIYGEPEAPVPAPAEGALPQTGDQSPLTLWFTLAAAALACMAVISRRRRHA